MRHFLLVYRSVIGSEVTVGNVDACTSNPLTADVVRFWELEISAKHCNGNKVVITNIIRMDKGPESTDAN